MQRPVVEIHDLPSLKQSLATRDRPTVLQRAFRGSGHLPSTSSFYLVSQFLPRLLPTANVIELASVNVNAFSIESLWMSFKIGTADSITCSGKERRKVGKPSGSRPDPGLSLLPRELFPICSKKPDLNRTTTFPQLPIAANISLCCKFLYCLYQLINIRCRVDASRGCPVPTQALSLGERICQPVLQLAINPFLPFAVLR